MPCLRWLLVAAPLSWVLAWLGAPAVAVFIACGIAIVPLAAEMGAATEAVAARTGPAVGGLLNATFGNAAELIVAVVALRAGLVDLVEASLVGSILRRCSFSHMVRVSPSRSSPIASSSMETAGARPVRPTLPTPPKVALAILSGATAFVALESELFVRATETLVQRIGLSGLFLGLIVIPLIGNAAEHPTAVVVSRHGQTDLALHFALGSSTQVALFVAPLLVAVGVLAWQPMSLVFTGFEVVVLGFASLIVTVIALDGESNWFEGAQLLALYALVALAVWFI